jgi:hypothetical protein
MPHKTPEQDALSKTLRLAARGDATSPAWFRQALLIAANSHRVR